MMSLSPYDAWMLKIRRLSAGLEMPLLSKMDPSNELWYISGQLYPALVNNHWITVDHVEAIKIFLYAFPLKQFLSSSDEKEFMERKQDSHSNGLQPPSDIEYELNPFQFSERIRKLDQILFDNIGRAYLSLPSQLAGNKSTKTSSATEVPVHSLSGSSHDAAELFQRVIASSSVAQNCIDRFYHAAMTWKDLRLKVYSAKFKIGLR